MVQFDFASGRARALSSYLETKVLFLWTTMTTTTMMTATTTTTTIIPCKPTYLIRRKIHENSFKSRTNTAKNRLEISSNDLRVCTVFLRGSGSFLTVFPFPGSSMPPTPQLLFKTDGQIQYFLIAFTLSSTRSFVYKPKKTSSSAFGYGVYKIER